MTTLAARRCARSASAVHVQLHHYPGKAAHFPAGPVVASGWWGRLRELTRYRAVVSCSRPPWPGELLEVDLPGPAGVARTMEVRVEQVLLTSQVRWLFSCRFLDPLQSEEVEILAVEGEPRPDQGYPPVHGVSARLPQPHRPWWSSIAPRS
jgi:hypothetical protein